ncbi:hypothetical protein CR513_05354, partial [Mucuna pruriens]
METKVLSHPEGSYTLLHPTPIWPHPLDNPLKCFMLICIFFSNISNVHALDTPRTQHFEMLEHLGGSSPLDIACLWMLLLENEAFDRGISSLREAQLEVDVQTGALATLAQFYDPSLRWYLFEKGRPYQYVGHYPSLLTIATSLKIDKARKRQNGGVDGFTKNYLEEHAQHLVKDDKWVDFMDILALTIYGIVLLQNIGDFVDFASIDVFLAYKHRKENPILAVLANIYHTLTLRHEKKGGTILCCLLALYT